MIKKRISTLIFVAILTPDLLAQQVDSLRAILQGLEGSERIDVLHQITRNTWYNLPEVSLNSAFEALDLSRTSSDTSNVSESLRLIGSTYYYIGEFNKSLYYTNQSLEAAQLVNDSSLMYAIYNNLGIIEYELGGLQYSYEYYLRAKELSERLGLQYGKGIILTNIGLLFAKIKDYEKALELFAEAYTTGLDIDSKDGQVYALNNTGITYLKMGDLRKAKAYLVIAKTLASEIGNITWGTVSLRNIGELYRREGNYDSADFYCQQSLKLSEEIGDGRGKAESYFFLSKIALDLGNIQLAEEYLNKSQKIAIELHSRNQLLENLQQDVAINLAKDQSGQVIATMRAYVDLKDSLLNDVAGKNLALTPIKLKEERDRIKLSQQQAEIKSKNFTNSVYSIFFTLAVPIVVLLIGLLKKNQRQNRKLKSYNDELKRTQDLLVKSEKMASIGVLAAGIGHEINNPLNYISGGIKAISAEIEEEYEGATANLKQYFDIVNEGVNRASAIVNSLAHFNRSGVDIHENCEVEKIIENCLVILNNQLRGVNVQKNYADKTISVNGNEGKLHQVFLNIISNAGQAVGNSGIIKISTQISSNSMIVSISDNGIGIPQENLLKISDPFFTTKSPGKGTGLGLFVTYTIIEEHKGDIHVISEPDLGTEFIVTLPLYQSPE